MKLVRYADDFVIMVHGHHSDAEALWGEVAAVLRPMGLRLSEAKTRLTHLDTGFDFLGWRIQRRLKKLPPPRNPHPHTLGERHGMSSRRPQGEGSVYRLPDGRWRGVVDLSWHEGKRRRKYITRSAQAEVVRELRRLTAAADAGRLPIARAPTLEQWLERYLDEVAASSVRPSSLRRYRQELRLYIAPALGKCRWTS